MITSAESNDEFRIFSSMIIKELSKVIGTNCYVYDAEKMLADMVSGVSYFDSNLLENFKKFGQIAFDMNTKYKDASFDPNSLKDEQEVVCVIFGLEKFKTILGNEFDGAFSGLVSMVKGMPKVSFIIIDTCDNMKKHEFEAWYKDTLSGTKGVWVGNGIANQYSLKSSLSSRVLSAKIDKFFGYYVDGNTTVLVKFISEAGEEDEYETL